MKNTKNEREVNDINVVFFSMCFSLIKVALHSLQESSISTRFFFQIFVFGTRRHCFFFVENFHIFLIFCLVTKYPKTPDNDTVLAALLEVMVETSMLLFRCLQFPLKHRSTKCLKSFETQCESA